jgi:hypothetical protein
MEDRRSNSDGTGWSSLLAVALGLAILGVLLLTPIKTWLNQIPNLWRVVYPMMALFAVALFVRSVQDHAGLVVLVKWVVLLAAALSATVHAYGGARIFFTLGRWGAILFITLEVITTLVEGLGRKDGFAGGAGSDL